MTTYIIKYAVINTLTKNICICVSSCVVYIYPKQPLLCQQRCAGKRVTMTPVIVFLVLFFILLS